MLYDEDKTTIVVILGILTLTALLFFILSGCATTYEYESDGTTFHVRSYREFKRIEVEYGDLHIVASGVTDDTSETFRAVTGDIFQTLDQAFWTGVNEGRRIQTQEFNGQ